MIPNFSLFRIRWWTKKTISIAVFLLVRYKLVIEDYSHKAKQWRYLKTLREQFTVYMLVKLTKWNRNLNKRWWTCSRDFGEKNKFIWVLIPSDFFFKEKSVWWKVSYSKGFHYLRNVGNSELPDQCAYTGITLYWVEGMRSLYSPSKEVKSRCLSLVYSEFIQTNLNN